jgi:hypothetical protein
LDIRASPISLAFYIGSFLSLRPPGQQNLATITPVPRRPGSEEYPGFVLTTTILTVLPEIVEPDFVTRLVTTVPM